MATLLISGTDTGVGKTVVTSALAAYLQIFCAHQPFAIFKPIQSGPGDREHYAQQFDLSQTLEQINPLYFEAPLAPPLAAAAEGKTVDLAQAWQAFQVLQKNYDWVLVEGVGGLGAPITAELTVADLAHDWHLRTVLVVPVRLGALGQAIANVALAQKAQVNLLGVILSCPEVCSAQDIEKWAPVELIQSFTQRPVLGILPHVENSTDSAHLAKIASQWDLEVLLPRLYIRPIP
ncbi:MAG: ATP-dependent dethiobiotin synthetase BioD [Acaryochloridaceae cyanobacterium RU_4_10]|nr:ATP-dependent dethiobiotin synthetase BioD [Acaryochloridaceae cyanobacterium RU_4_10]